MATDYGTDLRALDDIPLSDDYVSGPDNVAYAEGRRLLTGNLADCGDEAEYESINLRTKIGARMDAGDKLILEAQIRGALSGDQRATSVTSSVTLGASDIAVDFSGTGAAGPFKGILSIDSVTGAELESQ